MKQKVGGSGTLGPYSPGMIAEGRFLFVSGQGPIRDGVPIEGDVGEQTRQVLENVGAVLAEANAGFSDVVRCGVFLTDINDFAAMNEVYTGYFPDPKPARTTIQAALPGGIGVEIDCIALLRE